METVLAALQFDTPRIDQMLAGAPVADLDELSFGVIGFDPAGFVRVYNRHEAEAAGLTPARVIGRSLFAEVAPCMNNFMVAHRFGEAATDGAPLDAVIDYVLTLRMRPTRVQLRLVSAPGARLAYVLLQRQASHPAADGRRAIGAIGAIGATSATGASGA